MRIGPLVLALSWVVARALHAAPAPVTADEAKEIATEAYLYAYPLVLMDVSRQVFTNVAAPDSKVGRAPVNQFGHMERFPDATFTDVVRPNADTLYSSLWFDVGREPLVIHVPDSGGRYYLLPMLDMWTDVFASPGARTTGTGEQVFAIVGPGWRGSLPAGVAEVRAPTAVGWMVGRTQANGAGDDDNKARAFQAGLTATPLGRWGKKSVPPASGPVNPNLDMSAPVDQVKKMDAGTFFARFAALTRTNPPHANDYPILDRMARIGLVPGRAFDIAKTTPDVKAALETARLAGIGQILATLPRTGTPVNGWRMLADPIGTYGTAFLRRAVIAYSGLGANVMQDAIYPSAARDGDGKPFDSGARYVVHFGKEQLPPVQAFWSLSMYDARQLFAANSINRCAIGDRDPLRFNADGSLDVYIQRASPGADKESNWLPTPQAGPFTLNLRLYWPGPSALEGSWTPPPVKRVE